MWGTERAVPAPTSSVAADQSGVRQRLHILRGHPLCSSAWDLGGFVDGIVLHQIRQWHHLLTGEGDFPMNTLPGLEQNTVADGFFHALTWVVVVAGMFVTLNAWQRRKLAPPWRHHVGTLCIGWGAFNLAEGIIDHQILGIHHVRDDLGGPRSWDIGFLAFGTLLVLATVTLTRSGASVVTTTGPTAAAD